MPTTLGLRERKKIATRRAISQVALRLAIERGPDAVTVEEIAAAADVSPRTVFNHFRTKDEAILGFDPDRRAAIVAEVGARPSAETPLEALAAVLSKSLTSDDETSQFWLARTELVARYPHLRAAQLMSQTKLERDLARVVAERAGLDADRDGYPALVVAVALTALRVVLARAAGAGRKRLRREIAHAFRLLSAGLRPTTGAAL